MTGLALGLAFLLILANGWFVASEFALVTSRPSRLEVKANAGSRRAEYALEALSDLGSQFAGTQLGVTMASLALGYIGESTIAGLLEGPLDSIFGWPSGVVHTVSFIVALLIVVVLHIVLGEMVPKTIAITTPERVAMFVAPVNRAVFAVFGPIIWVLTKLADGIVIVLGFEPTSEIAHAHTRAELSKMFESSLRIGEIDEFEHGLLAGVLDFGEQTAGSVMVPAARIAAVDRTMSLSEVEAVIVRTGHSRLPVSGSTGLDDVIGYVHAKDLVRLDLASQSEPVPLEAIRRLPQIQVDTSLESVLVRLKQNRQHLAIIKDEGATVGLLSLEDVVEELVGEITDETDR